MRPPSVLAILCIACIAAMACCGIGGCERDRAADATPHVTVFAAASTEEVLADAGRRFSGHTGIEVAFSFDASSTLARQIALGAPADVFVSADERWMDEVASLESAIGARVAATRQDLLANGLVMIAATGAKWSVEFTPTFDFSARLPHIRRIAVGDPSHVPAGRYAQRAFASLGWLEAVEKLLLPAHNVRAALRLVEIGEADAGVVYATDARQSERVIVVGAFPSDLLEPIRYPVALCTDSSAAHEFVAFLRSAEMLEVFAAAGFTVLPASEP